MIQFDEKFFVAAATIAFFALTFKPLKNALLGMVDSRIEKIKKDLAEAERLKNEAKALLDEAQKNLSASEQQSKAIIENAKVEADNIIKNTKQKLEKDVENRKNIAMQKIQSFEENAITELKKNVSNITIAVASHMIEENNNEEDFKKLVNASLDKLSKTVH